MGIVMQRVLFLREREKTALSDFEHWWHLWAASKDEVML